MTTALVTGGNRGLGFECCKQLAASGCRVFLGARDLVDGQEAAARIGHKVTALALDVTNPVSISAAVEEVQRHAKALDILINNAGIYPDSDGDPVGFPAAHLSQALQSNVVGPHAVIQAMLPLLRKSEGARIVNVSSGLGSLSLCAPPGGEFAGFISASYSPSKAALNMLTLSWAKALANSKIKVNAVSPGWCSTDMGGPTAPRSPAEGAATLLKYARIPADGPTGGFFGEDGPIPW